jgi:sodium/potassium-transporting ATPase subunit alpha
MRIEDMSKYHEHHIALADLMNELGTQIDTENPRQSIGLSLVSARAKRERDGPNKLSPPKRTPAIIRFLAKFLDGLMILLMAAGE